MCPLMLRTLWIQTVRWHQAEKHLVFCLATFMTKGKMAFEEQHLAFCLDIFTTKIKMFSEEQHLIFCQANVTTNTKIMSEEQHLVLCLATVMANIMMSEEQHLVFCLATVRTNTKMASVEQHYWLISQTFCILRTRAETLNIIEWVSAKIMECHSGINVMYLYNICTFNKLLFFLWVCLPKTKMWFIISNSDVTIRFEPCYESLWITQCC